jgi:hypothetical protein
LAFTYILQHCHCYSRGSSLCGDLPSEKPSITSFAAGFGGTSLRGGGDSLCAGRVGLPLSLFQISKQRSFETNVCSIAGFFLWIDLSKCFDKAIAASQGGWAAESDLSRRLQQIGVEMSTGYAYHNEAPGWFRVIFSLDEESLKEGLSR